MSTKALRKFPDPHVPARSSHQHVSQERDVLGLQIVHGEEPRLASQYEEVPSGLGVLHAWMWNCIRHTSIPDMQGPWPSKIKVLALSEMMRQRSSTWTGSDPVTLAHLRAAEGERLRDCWRRTSDCQSYPMHTAQTRFRAHSR